MQGALATAATFCLLSWAISIKGPTYPPMFNPLALIFVALSEALILGEPLKAGTYEHFFLINIMLTFQFPFIFILYLSIVGFDPEATITEHSLFDNLALVFPYDTYIQKITNLKSICRLLGMVLIITGLYSFLWGKRKETKSLPQANVAAGEVSTSIAAEPAGAPSTAVVVPSSSPINSVVLEVESKTGT